MSYIKRLMHGNQKGFTLAEILLAMLITVIIGGGIYLITTQVFTVPSSNSTHLVAVRQVDQAIDAISRDAMQANGQTNPTKPPISVNGSNYFIDIKWTDFLAPNTKHDVTYTIDSTAKTLKRSFDNGTAVVVATNIDPATSCSLNGNTLNLNIVSTVKGLRSATEIRQVQIVPRPG